MVFLDESDPATTAPAPVAAARCDGTIRLGICLERHSQDCRTAYQHRWRCAVIPSMTRPSTPRMTG